MSIRTILTPIDGSPASVETAKAGFCVGRELGAHVDAIHVRTDPKDTIPLLGEGMSVAMIEDMVEIAEKDSRERRDAASSTFNQAASTYDAQITDQPTTAGFTASWSEEVGRDDEVIARRGRLSDVIIVGRPGDGSDVTATLSLNAALFETGRPVMVVPSTGIENISNKIAISWNGSAQSAKAVASAMPLIKNASKVTVFTIDNDQTSAARAPELVKYLEWHGVEADMRTLEAHGNAVGAELLREAGGVGAELLVMGAYTHSRMRQLILGGVTRHVLENSTIPLFMAH